MEAIEIAVTGRDAQVIRECPVTAGAVGMEVSFTFDSGWDSLQKTAVFRSGNKTYDCLMKENVATVPWELVQRPGCMLLCGVYGSNDDGSLQIPTLWVELGEVQPGADPSGDVSADPTLPVWQQLEQDISQALDAIIALQEGIIQGEIVPYEEVTAL